jgi:ADP-ribose pyrophosphatase YjhB (NUDIX family)
VSLLLRAWKFLGRWPAFQQILLRLLYPSFLVGVVAVVFDDRGRALLFHHTYRRVRPWSLPGGWMGRGEEPEAALEREFREEANLTIAVERPLRALAVAVHPNFEVIYRARLVGGEFRPSVEVDRAEFFELDALPDIRPHQREVILAAHAGLGS